MVSLLDLEAVQTKAAVHGASVSGEVENMDTCRDERMGELDEMSSSASHEDAATRLKRLQQQKQSQQVNGQMSNESSLSDEQEASDKVASAMNGDLMMEEDMDEEQLKRILACKRLSEGCNRFAGANMVCRKNSLHIMGESLAPVTEGEPMRHMSHHLSQNMESTSSSSVSSGSFRGGAGRHHMMKRNSQDDNTTSCSSSTSLDGPRSPTRRRSSTVSQCSSVLSEGTRQQLNFDLSPDLPPDSSILEANTISPTEFERPASPEPSSLASGDGSFDMRPISRMSQYCDESMLTGSPDSTLGDSNENSNPELLQNRPESRRHSPSGNRALEDSEIRDNLERIITHVSTVKVTAPNQADGLAEPASQSVSQKRAHTPFGANLQRVKTSLISQSPSPTSNGLPRG